MTGWVVQTLVATSLLLLVVLALRGTVARHFGPRAAYALWALPALRMILPPLPGWHALYIPVWHWGDAHKTVGLVDPQTAATLALDPGAAAAPLPPMLVEAPVHVATISWSALLLSVWLGVALLWFGWQMLRYQAFLRGAMASAWRLSRECGIDILISEHVDGPVAAGVWRRRIFLPSDFMTRYAPAERRLALLHEGAHHDRRDILANLAALAVLALNWWNPLAYRAYRLFRADQELACDATVLADIGKADRHAYGSAVVKSVSARMPGVACALSHKAELKRRLQVMANAPIRGSRLWLGAAVAAGMVGTGLMVTASGHASTVPPQTEGLSADDIAQIRADAEEARREGQQAAEEGRREAREAADEARRETAEARREATQAREEARHTSYAYGDAGARAIAATRRQMAAHCSSLGKHVSESADWTTLALCGDSPSAIVHRSLVAANVGQSAYLSQADADRAQAAADRAQADVERHQALMEAQRERQAAEQERRQALAEADQERRQALAEAEQERRQAQQEAREERRQALAEAARERDSN